MSDEYDNNNNEFTISEVIMACLVTALLVFLLTAMSFGGSVAYSEAYKHHAGEFRTDPATGDKKWYWKDELP